MAFSQRVRLFARPIVAVVLGALTACNRNSGPIRIGVAGALSDSIGQPMKRAAELAAEEINAAGGINGRPLTLVFGNDYGDPDSAVVVAKQFYESAVAAVVGHLSSGTTLAAATVYGSGQEPVAALSPSASSAEIADAGDYIFRIAPSDLAHGAALARWAHERLGFRRGAVLYVNTEYGRGVRQAFAETFTRLGGELVSIDPYLGDPPEVGPFLERMVRAGRPDFLVAVGSRREAEEIIRQSRQRGLTIPVLGSDGLAGIEHMGKLADGVYYSSAYFTALPTAANRHFLAAYRKRYSDREQPNQVAAATYDAVYLLRDVITRTGTDREKVRTALAQVGTVTPPFHGVTGTIAFGRSGEASTGNVYIGRVQNGTVDLPEGR